ncbi:MAG: YggT family protein [Xenococcaceae cyanobacterium MO_188.B32]|nr:YggT family protein [Xenococcaceae cyanobacterium MO_188.B32]
MTQEPHRSDNELRLKEEERRLAAVNWNAKLRRLTEVIYYLTGALIVLLLIRVVLSLFGANPENKFASFIYGLSATFIAPFLDLFPTPALGNFQLEINTLVALGVYGLLAWLVVRLIWLGFSRPYG